jgi:hypothetical protein
MPSGTVTRKATRFQGDGKKRSSTKATMISIGPATSLDDNVLPVARGRRR